MAVLSRCGMSEIYDGQVYAGNIEKRGSAFVAVSATGKKISVSAKQADAVKAVMAEHAKAFNRATAQPRKN